MSLSKYVHCAMPAELDTLATMSHKVTIFIRLYTNNCCLFPCRFIYINVATPSWHRGLIIFSFFACSAVVAWSLRGCACPALDSGTSILHMKIRCHGVSDSEQCTVVCATTAIESAPVATYTKKET